ncbi:MAG: hypothetical protein GC206_01780 [Alphaproteobacteria bacterium]|nr:hypothetical protein [Alphaproteobacteria bacterium]
MTTRRSLVQCGAGLLFGIDAVVIQDRELADLWSRFLSVARRLDRAWAHVEARHADYNPDQMSALFERADALGHEHDRIVKLIAAQRSASWRGVTIKLLTWRRTANLSEFKIPDADAALAFSAYLDALRLKLGAPSGILRRSRIERGRAV